MQASNESDIDQGFWCRVQIAGDDECWPWIGTTNPRGYGVVGYMNRTVGAHTLAYRLTYGPIANGYRVLHKCDLPSCCNPKHLSVGVREEVVSATHKLPSYSTRRQVAAETRRHEQHRLRMEYKKAMIQMIAERATVAEMATRLCVSKSYVYLLLKRFNLCALKKPVSIFKVDIDSIDMAALQEALRSGCSLRAIATHSNVEYYKLYNKLRDMGYTVSECKYGSDL